MPKSIDQMIHELIERLPDADNVESARIHDRIQELETLKAKYGKP